MPRRLSVLLVALVLAGCGRSTAAPSAATSPEPSVTASGRLAATSAPAPTVEATATSPAPAPAAPKATNTPLPAPAPAATPGSALAVAGTGKSGLRLRDQPNGKVIQVLPEGSRLQALGDQQQTAGFTWIHVHTADGKDGWVAAPFVAAAPAAATPTAASQ